MYEVVESLVAGSGFGYYGVEFFDGCRVNFCRGCAGEEDFSKACLVVSGSEFRRVHFRAVSCGSLDDANCNAAVDAVLQVVVEDDAVDVSAEFGAVDVDWC